MPLGPMDPSFFHYDTIKWVFHKFNICLCRAYDRAAVKFRGLEADINFIISDYEEDLKQVLITDVENVMKTCML